VVVLTVGVGWVLQEPRKLDKNMDLNKMRVKALRELMQAPRLQLQLKRDPKRDPKSPERERDLLPYTAFAREEHRAQRWRDKQVVPEPQTVQSCRPIQFS